MARRPVRSRNPKPNAQNQRKPVKGGIKKRPSIKPKVQDARQKLILKKRQKMVDARDVLAKLAKTQDARNKLNKLRQKRAGINTSNGNIKVIGKNILQKTDRNGKITLVTNKNKSASDMNVAIQKELGLLPSPKKTFTRNSLANPRIPQTVRQTVLTDVDRVTYSHVPRGYDPSLYKWPKPGNRTAASQLIGSLESRPSIAYLSTKPIGFIDLDEMEDEDMPLVSPVKQTITLKGSSRISNVHSRLDGIPIEPETHGILSQTKTKVVVPAGHRIVVSNLQSTVTQDDVKELFEDIGQLLAARLVRPGVAEVIYKNLKDAQKAVDTYHNRQLDGQPMKCLLVNKRPLNNPTAPPLSKMEGQGYFL